MDYTSSLPTSNRTTEVMASVFNRFVEDATSIVAVPSKRQGEDPFDEPPYIGTFSLLEISELSKDRAVEVDKIIHDRRLIAKWGDYATDDTRDLKYGWHCLCIPHCTMLIKRDGDKEFRILHPVLFYADSDVDLILNFSRNPFHQRKYAELGITDGQMDLSTYDWDTSNPRSPAWKKR